MANNTRKTTTKKTTTAKKTSAAKTTKPIVEEVDIDVLDDAEEEVVEEEVAPVEKKVAKKVFHSDDMILCRSTTAGKVTMEGYISKNVYRWLDYGSECEVEYRDLQAAVRNHSTFIYAPRFIVEDEDFVNEFAELKKFYNEKFTVKELSDIIYMSEDEMAKAIEILPKGAKEELINLASTYVANGTLDSIRKIKELERLLNVDFSLVAEIK